MPSLVGSEMCIRDRSCTRPISANPGSMEAGEDGLTRRTCFLTCRFELDAVAGLLWILWCVLGGAIFSVFFFRFCFFFERTRPAASMRPPCPIYLSTSTGVRTGCHYLSCLSVCVCVRVCVTFVVCTDCESCTGPISTNPVSMKAGEYGLTRGTCFIASRLELHAVAGLLWTSWSVLGGADVSVIFFFSILFFLRTHAACCKYEATLPHLPLHW